MFQRTIGRAGSTRTVAGPRRRFVILALIALAALMLPIAASGYISTGPGGDTSWYWENPLPQGNDLMAHSWVDSLHGWAVGRNGVVLSTSDGGVTWAYRDPKISSDQRNQKDLSGVAFTSVTDGWIVGGNGLIKKTADGGSTWTTVTPTADMSSAIPKAISAYDANHLIIVGQGGAISWTSDGGAHWADATTNPAKTAGATLASVCWVDASTAYAVGDNGMIVKTTNGGSTWTQQTSGVSGIALYGVSFAPGTTTGYAVGANAASAWTVLRTTNGGSTWTALPNQANTPMFGVDMLDANTCIVVGASGVAYRTTNASASSVNSVAWSNITIGQMSGPSLAVRAVAFTDSTHVAVVGDSGTMFTSADSGTTWTTQSASVTSNLQASWFTDTNHGWVAGANGTIERTSNGGAGWVGTSVGTGTWRGIAFTDNSNGYVVGDAGAIRRTTDSGATWSSQVSGVTQQLNAVWFSTTTTQTGFAVGNGGTLLRTSNGGTTWTAVPSGTTSNLTAVYFQDPYHGWAVGLKSTILYISSANSGSTWTVTKPTAAQKNKTLNGVRGVPGTNYVWIVGNGGLLWSSSNGTTWTNNSSSTGTTQNLYAVYYANTTQGWIGGANGTIRVWNQASGAYVAATTSGLPSNTTVSIHGISFTDTNNGYFVADNGIIRKSTNGGAVWTSQQYGTYSQLNAVAFSDSAHGWIGGNSGLMLATVDGGNSWFAQTSGTNGNIYGVAFANATSGWLVGGNGVVNHTTDGGNSWSAQTSGVTSQLNGVGCKLGDASHAIAVGDGGIIRYTLNGGSTWTSATTIPRLSYGDTMLAVAFPDTTTAGVAFVAANHTAGNGHPGILKTTDYGATWTTATVGTQPAIAIDFAPSPNGNYGWAAAALGAMYKTSDGGTTWVSQTTPLSTSFTGVAAVDTQTAFAVGQYGVAAQTSNGGTTWLTQNSGYGSIGSGQRLLAVTFTDSNHGYTVGSNGTILRTTSQVAPVTSLFVSPDTPDGTNGWYGNSLPRITLTPDQQAQPYYSWDVVGGPFSAYTSSLTEPEGVHTLYYYSINAANKVETAKSASFKSDLTPPSIPGTPVVSAFDNNSLSVSWAPATDALSGIAYYEVWVQSSGGDPTLAATTSPVVTSAYATGLLPNTSYSVWVDAVDVAGNTSDNSVATLGTTFSLPPLATTAAVSPLSPNGQNGWYVTTPTVTLTSSPATVSAYTYYAWDASALTTYTTPIPMPQQGTHTLYFRSADVAGQRGQETTKSAAFKLDTSSPIAPSTVSASGASTSSLNVSWSGASDAQSGIDHYDLWVGGTKYGTYTGTSATVTGLSVNTSYSVYVVVANGAGLSAVSSSVSGLTLSNPAVSTLASVLPATPDGQHGWYVSSPTVMLASQPAGLSAWTLAGWDGSALTTYTPGFSLAMPGEGTHALRYLSLDQADASNRESTQTLTLKRDTVPPSAPAAVSVASLDTTSIAVSWTAGFDGTSGVDHYLVYVDDAPMSVSGTSTVVSGLVPNTLHSFAIASVDAAGNVGSPTIKYWAVTTALPPLTTTASASFSADGSNGWYVTTPTVSFSVAPAVAAFTYSAWDGSAVTTVTGGVSPAVGTHTLSFWSVDTSRTRANEATQQLTFKLDVTKPSTATLSVAAASPTSLAVSWTPAADPQSDIDHYTLYVNGSLTATYSAGTSGASLTGLAVNTSYDVQVKAVNGAGLVSSSDPVTQSTLSNAAVYTLHAIAPASPDGDHGWYVTVPSITLVPMPADVTTARTYFAWGGDDFAPYLAPLSPAADGVYALHYFTQDSADLSNIEATRTQAIKLDTAKPTPPASVSATSAGTTAIDVAWSLGNDVTSGVDHYVLYVDDAPYATVSATGTTVTGLLPNSIHRFKVYAVDAAGWVSDASPEAFGAASPLAALTTTATANPAAPDGTNGWYVTLPHITFSVTPDVPADTHFAWDGDALAIAPGDVTPPSDGTHVLAFWSVDQANQSAHEATQQLTYKVDRTAPSAPTNLAASAASTTSLQVSWDAAADGQSAIDHYEVWVGGTKRAEVAGTSATVTGLAVNHTYAVRVVAVDGAGLSAASASVDAATDADPAITTTYVLSPSTPDGLNGWYLAAPTVTLGVTPAGVPADTFFAWDGGAYGAYGAPFTMPGEGSHDVSFYSVDQADSTNRDTTATLSLKLDTTPPSPPTSLVSASLDTTSVALEWSLGADSASGVDHYVVYADGIEYSSVAATGTTVTGLTPNTLHTFQVYAVDKAGRTSAAGSPIVTAVTGALDALVTSTAVSPASPDGLNGWYVTTPTVTFSVTPAVPAETHYSWDGGAWSVASGPVAAPGSGAHTLSFWSIDIAGHRSVEATQQVTLHVDAAPDVRETPTAPAGIAAHTVLVTDSSALLSWAPPTSAASGIDRYEIWDEYVGSTSGTSFLVSGLSPLHTYGYRIYAVSGAGTYFSQSDTVTVETSAAPKPVAPTNVVAVSPDGGFINVNWQYAASYVGTVGYHVWRSSDGVGFSQVATLTGQYSTYYTDPNLYSSTRYWYAVTTFDDRGESSLSDVSAATWALTAPTTGRPERVAQVHATPSSNDVLLSWPSDANPGVVGYLVTRAGRSLGAETTVTPYQLPAVSSPSWEDTSAVNGETYYYRVYPVDASGTVGYGSVEVEAKPFDAYAGSDIHVVKTDLKSSSCSSCHSAHAAVPSPAPAPGQPRSGNALDWPESSQSINANCLRCHALGSQLASTDTSSEIGDPKRRSEIPMWTQGNPDSSALSCMDCHRAISQEGTPTAGLMSSGNRGMSGHGGPLTGNQVCYACHGENSTLPFGDMRGFESSVHNSVPDPTSGSKIKCTACHESHASRNDHLTKYTDYMVCMQCHTRASGGNDTDQDIWTKLTLNDSPNSKHPLLPQDWTTGAKMTCQNCHNTHAVTADDPLVDPHDPSPAGVWSGSLLGNQKDFCFSCHNGRPLPTAAETAPWASAVTAEGGATTVTDIQDAWPTNVHGNGTASDVTTATALLREDMGYMVGDSMDCGTCHDPHGTSSNFALKSSIKSADGLKTISGVLVYQIPAGSITPTSPVGYDLRFFCGTCHKFDPATHDAMAHTDTTQFGKTDCTRCHRHVRTNGTPTSRL